jgi:NitT/TauT family transport system substrate-binding protein
LDIKITAPWTAKKEGYSNSGFIVRKDLYDSGKITKPSDLKGAVVATNTARGLVEYYWVKYLEMGGLTLDDVELVSMRFSDMNVALANQAIDAAYMGEPYLSSAINDGYGELLIKDMDVVGYHNSAVFLFGKRMIEPENHEVGVRFFKAYMRAARELVLGEGYSDENIEIISKYTNTDPAVTKSLDPYYYDPNANINTDFIEGLMRYDVIQGYTEFSEPLDLTNLYDFSYVQEAVDRLGRVEE